MRVLISGRLSFIGSPCGRRRVPPREHLVVPDAPGCARGGWYPRQESNLGTWFRKPLLYPLSYGGVVFQRPVNGGRRVSLLKCKRSRCLEHAGTLPAAFNRSRGLGVR